MRRLTLLTVALLIIGGSLSAQGAYDALLFSQQSYSGSGRTMALGNAFTSLGGDSYAITINPASSGFYNYTEVSFTPSLVNEKRSSLYLNNGEKESWSRGGVANLALISPFRLGTNRSGLSNINFGIAINSLNDYTSRSFVSGVNSASSWLASLADEMSGLNSSYIDITDSWDPFREATEASWREILAWNSNLVDPLGGNDYIAATENLYFDPIEGVDYIEIASPLEQRFFREQKGNSSEVLFNMGANFSNRFYLGLNIAVQSLHYVDYQRYSEEALSPHNFDSQFQHFSHTYRQTTSGIGASFKLGIIANPFDNFRVGATITTPTWYHMSDLWEESIDAYYSDNYRAQIASPLGEYDYRITTPFKWSLGLSYIFGEWALFSVDYEGVDYSNIRMASQYGRRDFRAENNFIADNFTISHIFRAGVEVKPLPNLAVRGGYMLYGSPEYNGESKSYLSGGLGVSGRSGLFADFALQKRVKSSEFFSLYSDYSGIGAPVGEMEQWGWRALLTIGMRF